MYWKERTLYTYLLQDYSLLDLLIRLQTPSLHPPHFFPIPILGNNGTRIHHPERPFSKLIPHRKIRHLQASPASQPIQHELQRRKKVSINGAQEHPRPGRQIYPDKSSKHRKNPSLNLGQLLKCLLKLGQPR